MFILTQHLVGCWRLNHSHCTWSGFWTMTCQGYSSETSEFASLASITPSPFYWDHYITNLNNALLQGRSHKITIDLYCLIPRSFPRETCHQFVACKVWWTPRCFFVDFNRLPIPLVFRWFRGGGNNLIVGAFVHEPVEKHLSQSRFHCFPNLG